MTMNMLAKSYFDLRIIDAVANNGCVILFIKCGPYTPILYDVCMHEQAFSSNTGYKS